MNTEALVDFLSLIIKNIVNKKKKKEDEKKPR